MTHRRHAYLLIGRIVSPAVTFGLNVSSRITKRPRVRTFVTNEYGEVLLLRDVISKKNQWTFPGGGVEKGESLPACAQRELHEETGIKVSTSKVRYLATLKGPDIGKPFDAPVFHIVVAKADLPDALHNPKEIAQVGWFSLQNLPESTSNLVDVVVAEYRT